MSPSLNISIPKPAFLEMTVTRFGNDSLFGCHVEKRMESCQEKTHARSEEEEDILRRTIKKARADDQGEKGPLMEEEMANKELTAETMSFREKLMGVFRTA